MSPECHLLVILSLGTRTYSKDDTRWWESGRECYPTHGAKDAPWMGHGGLKVQVQQRILKTGQRITKQSHRKDGKQRTFPTFRRHSYYDLYDSIRLIRCTWNLNPPTHCRGLLEDFVEFGEGV
jgi:hypothetical protein